MPEIDVEVLLPVHNEGESIDATIRAIWTELSPIARVGFIVCEDGSRDNTKEILRRLAQDLPMRLNLSDTRKGYSRAMREGMAMTQAPYLLCLDSDGQCDPADFAEFWQNRQSAEILIGWRTQRADTLVRKTFSRFFYLLYQAVFWTPVHDPSCPFVLFSRDVAHRMSCELGAMREGFWWEFVARAHRHRFTIREFPVNHRLRSSGVTQVYRWSKMPGIFFRHAIALFRIWNQTRTA